jgi:hypothetical protein
MTNPYKNIQHKDDLLELVLEASGGLKRWSNIQTLTTRLSASGPFWELKGYKNAFLEETLEIDVQRQHTVFTPWVESDQKIIFDGGAERVILQHADGQTVESRTNPRASFEGYDMFTPWDKLQVGYFLSYAMWNYLTTPYLFTFPGVEKREIEPWDEDGQTWRRLHVTFPKSIATHTAEQTFYYDSEGILKRMDYTVDVNGDAVIAHYMEAYKTFDGMVFPTRRLVYPRNPDGTVDRSFIPIIIDIHDITIA